MIETNCTIHLQGKDYTANGAMVTENYLIAYPAANGRLNDWHGNRIGTYKVISARPAIFFGRRSWQGSHYYYMRAQVNGLTYSLRGFGTGMIAKGKRVK